MLHHVSCLSANKKLVLVFVDFSNWYLSAVELFNIYALFSTCVHYAQIDFHSNPTSPHPKQICHSCHLQFMFKLAQINLIILPQIFGCFLMWKFVFADAFPPGRIFQLRKKTRKFSFLVQWPESLLPLALRPIAGRDERHIIFHPFASKIQQRKAAAHVPTRETREKSYFVVKHCQINLHFNFFLFAFSNSFVFEKQLFWIFPSICLINENFHMKNNNIIFCVIFFSSSSFFSPSVGECWRQIQAKAGGRTALPHEKTL